MRGAIMLNDKMDHVLLVKGWKKTATWSFPRGKINKDEPDIDCAMREAWEETGFDIKAAGIAKDLKKVRHIEKTLRDQSVKLFVFRGVPIDYPFVPQTRKEISKCEWYKISDLPTNIKSKHVHQEGSGHHLVVNANKFYMVAPFVQELKKIISQLRKGDHRQSSKLAAPPTDAEAVDLRLAEQQVNALLQEAPVIMSPAVPSSLPEVDPVSVLDHSLRFNQQLDTGPSANLDKSNPAMSNALLSMLRGAPVAEMRHDPQTPLEWPSYPSSAPSYNMQVSPPVEMQQISYPAVPAVSSSHQQQLNQHTRSLLDTFSQPKMQNPAFEARQQLPPSKQDLLAAFMSKPKVTSVAPADTTPSTNHASNLLQMLQRTPNMSEASTQTIAAAEPAAHPIQEAPAVNSPVQPQQVRPNPLLDLLKGNGPAVTPISVPSTTIPNSGQFSAASVADNSRQVQPAELSATFEHEKKPSAAGVVRRNTPSTRDTASPKIATRNVPKEPVRKGSTAANLSGPIVQPQFDAIKAPVSEDDLKRPSTGPRKLFDHKNDEFRPSPIKIGSRQEDRSRQKSPRVPRHQKPSHATPSAPPREPKEAPKPFQPQILKRPQTAEGEAPPFAALSNPSLPAGGLAGTMTTQSPDPVFMQPVISRSHSAVPDETHPISPSLSTAAIPITTASSKPLVQQDPQREALLSLLRTPSQAQSQTKSPQPLSPVVDTDSTPRPITTLFTTAEPQTIQPTPISGPSPPPPVPFYTTQIVSPVNEVDLASTRSRVSSMASTANGLATGSIRDGNSSVSRPQPEKRQTAAGDKAFLMNYLKGFASQEQEAS